jgi:hypothetical protein
VSDTLTIDDSWPAFQKIALVISTRHLSPQ